MIKFLKKLFLPSSLVPNIIKEDKELPAIDLASYFSKQAEQNFDRLNSITRLKYGDDAYLTAPFDRDVYEVRRKNEVIATFLKHEFLDKILDK